MNTSNDAMQEPASKDVTIYQGATFELPWQYVNASGVPVNLDGYTIDATLWNRTATVKLATFQVNYVDAPAGKFNLRLSANTTKTITEQGQYDVLVTEPTSDKFYLLKGNAFWQPGLTGR